jgi:chemotaxis protein methyltransferase CheR
MNTSKEGNKRYVLTDNDIQNIIDEIKDHYGFDFNDYAVESFKRRISRVFVLGKFNNFAQFSERLKSDKDFAQFLLQQLTVNVTEMFRDPTFFKYLREVILPELAGVKFIRIWHAGCSTGEEVYSMAILLKEAGLLDKSLLYATDINPEVLEGARQGIFPLSKMKQYSVNYHLSGGKEEFSKYYSALYSHAKFDSGLTSKMVFAMHNLVSDRSFNEFHLIVCRNVLIYFNRNLQEKVFSLFTDSLASGGFLALGTKETIKFSALSPKYVKLETQEKVWRKV